MKLAREKDVFAILLTGLGKSLIFQLYPRLERLTLDHFGLTLSLEKQAEFKNHCLKNNHD